MKARVDIQESDSIIKLDSCSFVDLRWLKGTARLRKSSDIANVIICWVRRGCNISLRAEQTSTHRRIRNTLSRSHRRLRECPGLVRLVGQPVGFEPRSREGPKRRSALLGAPRVRRVPPGPFLALRLPPPPPPPNRTSCPAGLTPRTAT